MAGKLGLSGVEGGRGEAHHKLDGDKSLLRIGNSLHIDQFSLALHVL